MAYNSESFYGGGYSSFDPNGGNFTGYRMKAETIGFPGSPATANQLGETINAAKHGTKVFEVSMLGMDDADQTIPKQHFKEMRALMKLSGIKPSAHGPLIDAAGFGERGWTGEEGRRDNERRMFSAIEKAQVLDPKGNIPIVFHSSNGAPGKEFRPGDKKKGEERFVVEKSVAINLETKQLTPLETEYKYRARDPKGLEGKGKLYTPEMQLESANETDWDNKLTDLATFNKHADEVMGGAGLKLREKYRDIAIIEDRKTGKEALFNFKTGKPVENFGEGERGSYERLQEADIFLSNVELNFNSAFDKAFKYGSNEQKKELKTLAEDYRKNLKFLGNDDKRVGAVRVLNPILKQQMLNGAIKDLRKITGTKIIGKNGKEEFDPNYGAPKIFREVESFAMDKAAQTFGNLAARSYDKYGKNTPVIAVENMWQGQFAFSKAEDMKLLLEKSRENMVSQLVDSGVGRSEAKSIAKKHLGITWDVGHLNQIRKKGFTEKDIIEQTKIIAKDKSLVKHVHLTDNFGYSDSHLLPGMGNVPIKGILEELEKTGRLDEMKKIVESGGFIKHFNKLPHSMVLSAFGSPIYGAQMAPAWNQVLDVSGSYMGGHGTINPEQHHSMYGAGFTTMPVELGGAMPGGQSRFGGTPMA